jgi:SanA protein
MRRKKVKYSLLALVLGLIIFGVPRIITAAYASSRVYTIEDVPTHPVAIVFGAGLSRNGAPSAVLRDRIEAAAQLYFGGKVQKLLMSGDNRFVDYNEPGAMLSYAVELGVPEKDIVLDYAGRRTYDTCYRARYIFGVKDAILVTQNFHMARALYTCNILGVSAQGVPADARRYLRRYIAIWGVRETLATTVALWEVWVSRPLPVLGKPERIFNSQHQQINATFFSPLSQEVSWNVPRRWILLKNM